MARIHYDTGDGTQLLQRTLAGYLTRRSGNFPVDPRPFTKWWLRNSTMRDLFSAWTFIPSGKARFIR